MNNQDAVGEVRSLLFRYIKTAGQIASLKDIIQWAPDVFDTYLLLDLPGLSRTESKLWGDMRKCRELSN